MISSESFRAAYEGNDSATSFAYGFPVHDKDHLLVTKTTAAGVETTLTVDVDYTVNGVGDPDSAEWKITYPISGSPLPDGDFITITPNLPLKQLTDFENQGGFFADTHEEAFDYLTLLVQQVQEQVDRCIAVSVGDQTGVINLTDITAAASAASASATAAGNSATAASNSAIAADASADAAAASASSVSLPSTPSAGDILYHNGSAWVSLAKGTAAQYLKMYAGASAPEWGTALGTAAFLTAGTSANNVVQLNGSAKLPAVDGSQLTNLPSSSNHIVIVEDQKAAGTDGDTYSSGAWRTHVLTAEVVDTGSLASLASNQITLAAGTYRVRASASAYDQSSAAIRIYNATGSAALVYGTNNNTSTSGSATVLEGRFTIAAPSLIELQMRTATSTARNGGIKTDWGETEIYAQVVLVKE